MSPLRLLTTYWQISFQKCSNTWSWESQIMTLEGTVDMTTLASDRDFRVKDSWGHYQALIIHQNDPELNQCSHIHGYGVLQRKDAGWHSLREEMQRAESRKSTKCGNCGCPLPQTQGSVTFFALMCDDIHGALPTREAYLRIGPRGFPGVPHIGSPYGQSQSLHSLREEMQREEASWEVSWHLVTQSSHPKSHLYYLADPRWPGKQRHSC